MLQFRHYIYLRYVLLINLLAALVPATHVKGRVNDPLANATWWTMNQHSAVLVVAAASVMGSALVYLVIRRGLQSRLSFILCGMFTGTFPANFYWFAAPADAVHPRRGES